MEEKQKLLERFYYFVEKIAKTRFGSGFIGFGISFATFYYIIGAKEKVIDDCDIFKDKKRREIDTLNSKITRLQDDSRIAFREGYKLGLSDSEEIMNKTLDNIDRIKGELGSKKKRELQEIKRLEAEVIKRKEVLSDG